MTLMVEIRNTSDVTKEISVGQGRAYDEQKRYILRPGAVFRASLHREGGCITFSELPDPVILGDE